MVGSSFVVSALGAISTDAAHIVHHTIGPEAPKYQRDSHARECVLQLVGPANVVGIATFSHHQDARPPVQAVLELHV